MGYLVDTYGLIEWFRNNNQNYKKYFENPEKLYISPLILMEFYFALYHEYGESQTEFLREIILKNFKLIKINQAQLIESAKFRSKMYKKKKKMSYTDTTIYILAKEHNIKVLTGDEHFRNLDNVAFVK
jgi:predicted nucleic acid-binding protein